MTAIPEYDIDCANDTRASRGDENMASMRDVARFAGVSTSTVSRVISGNTPVGGVTAQKVRAAIEKFQYKPNLLAAGLRSKSGKSVGLLVPRISGDPFFAKLIDHVDRYVISRGYNLLLVNTHSDPAFEEEMIDNLLRRHVDGLIFTMVSDESRAKEFLKSFSVPVVMLDRVRDTDGLFSVVVNNRKAGKMAAEHLVDLGHRQLACVTGPRDVHLAIERLDGFVHALAKYGIRLSDERIIQGDFTYQSGLDAAEKIAILRPTVTAVWAQNDLMACGIVHGLAKAGIRVPDQLSVVGMDDIEAGMMLQPSLTTIAQPINKMASLAVSLVIDGPQGIKRRDKYVLRPSLVIRESAMELRE